MLSLDNAWYSQLKAAADGVPPAQGFENGSASVTSIKRDMPIVNHGTNQSLPKALDPSNKMPEPSQRVLPSQDVTSTSPPKKMLKIRSDGKLTSPKLQKPNLTVKQRTKRANPKSGDCEKSKVVVIKYGNDGGRRRSLGEKISSLLAGSNMTPKAKSGAPSQPVTSQQDIAKTIIAPKATHPFFQAKRGQASRMVEPKPKNNPIETITQIGGKTSPRKVASVTKIIRRSSLNGIAGPADRPAGFSLDKVPKYAGAIEALWPPRGMAHTRSLVNEGIDTSTSLSRNKVRKLKGASVRVQEAEDILQPYYRLIRSRRAGQHGENPLTCPIRRPVRKLMTSPELQRTITKNLQCHCLGPPDDTKDHALRHLHDRIAKSMTAFDRFECDTHEWVHKYAPTTAAGVLQSGREVKVLRDWLRSLTINAVENRSSESTRNTESSVAPRRNGPSFKRKRRKRADELDGFVISSDEEIDELAEITPNQDVSSTDRGHDLARKSVIRGGDAAKMSSDHERPSNGVVISGPHGCGKTAAVYAVAQELGFEVFEINSGSRRSGKDLLDKVGDMTKNHLVNHKQEELNKELVDDTTDMLTVTDSLKRDLESGRQGTMNKFFQPEARIKDKTTAKPRGRPAKKEAADKKSNVNPPKAQKQSLILLEEVDVLFEDDKQFWTITLELILRSRRPVIMTCTDESFIPLDDMTLFAVLRFSPAPGPLATDYLLLLACNEGHLLSRDAVSALYRAKGHDIRASIAELNYFCQMAIGDAKGGLDWLLIASSTEKTHNEKGEKLRVVSDGTYPHGLGWLSQEYRPHDNADESFAASFEAEIELLAEVWNGWGLDLAGTDDYFPLHPSNNYERDHQELNLSKLQALDDVYEALSVADVCAPLELEGSQSGMLDPTQPAILEKARSDYVEGATLLQADSRPDYTGTNTSLALAIRLLARRLVPDYTPLTEASIIAQLPTLLEAAHSPLPVTAETIRTAFAPLSVPNALSSLTGPGSNLAVDVAPYIRSIAAYDLRLEDHRRRLDDLLSSSQAGAGDARNTKRTRTTRASRAALEGGAKATTRRERWFPNGLNFSAVSRTGGKTWSEVAFGRMQAADPRSDRQNSERRTSIGSVQSNDG